LLGFIKISNNANRPVIEKLLIDSYISSKTKEAFSIIGKKQSPENKLAYQKKHFYRGLELYADRKYPELLKCSRIHDGQVDPSFTARATF
jgi:hypothetical protein